MQLRRLDIRWPVWWRWRWAVRIKSSCTWSPACRNGRSRGDRACKRCDLSRERPQYTAIRGRWRRNSGRGAGASGFRCLFLCKKYRRTARKRSLFRPMRAGFSVRRRYQASYSESKSLRRTSWWGHLMWPVFCCVSYDKTPFRGLPEGRNRFETLCWAYYKRKKGKIQCKN